MISLIGSNSKSHNIKILAPFTYMYVVILNARCGDSTDFIEGVDNLPLRTVLDFTHNAYSDIFIGFLINVKCCIVNGRNSVQDDFTFISTRGSSVVDYCLLCISNFSVIRASSLVAEAGVISQVDPSSKIPDHSFLRWLFGLEFNLFQALKIRLHPEELSMIWEIYLTIF